MTKYSVIGEFAMWKKIVFYVFWFVVAVVIIILGFKMSEKYRQISNPTPPAIEQPAKKLTLGRAQTLLDAYGRKKGWKFANTLEPKVYRIKPEEKGWVVLCYIYEKKPYGSEQRLEKNEFLMIVRVRNGELTVVQVGFSPGQ